MKRHHTFIYLLALLLTLANCTATKSTSSVSGESSASATERDGSSQEKAIVVKSVDAEYEWIRKNYPGAQVGGQALIQKGGKYYDRIDIVTSSGEKKALFFDINSFFGKF